MIPDSPPLALTQAQAGVLLGQHLAGNADVFYAAEYTELRGPLEPTLFMEALHATLAEADSLRFRLIDTDDGPRQLPIIAPVPIPLLVAAEDLDETEFLAELSRQSRQAFASEDGFLYEHRLYRRAAERYVWLHRAHHLLLDGYGFQLIARRTAARYAELVAGNGPVSAEFGNLAAVVDADLAYQNSAAREADRQYWLDTLVGLAPKSLCRNPIRGIGRGRRVGGVLPDTVVTRLKTRAVELDLSWPELLIAGFAGYLAQFGHGDDAVLGLTTMLRASGAAARTPCTAMNVMPLPFVHDWDRPLAEIGSKLRQDLARHRPHQRYRFEHLEFDLEQAGYPPGLLGTEINIMPFQAPTRFGPCEAMTRTLAAGPVEDLAAVFMARGDVIVLDLDGRIENYDEPALRDHWQHIVGFLAQILA
ncbi:condensation domain-containing protein [Methylomonas sp. EFPC3]|uniref:condensation domain-containing protein n=1 Tax=unclassified Methylomonas TaxID=2608980 RepID=UPI0024163663|nr:condensation domain-containing protein [Methylomonas sp. EFPC3]WFP50543.1 condensation domain-containing protein [Methylomonas sp. EFPC3]